MFNKNLKVSSWSEWASILTAAITMVLVLIFTATSFNEFIDSKALQKELARAFLDPVSLAPGKNDEIAGLKKTITSLSSTVAELQGAQGSSPQPVQVAYLDTKIEALSSRLSVLESAISNSPERALAVPMLRKDHDALAKQVNDSAIALKFDYDRLWGILMLILTVVGTAVLGVGGWVFKNLVIQSSRPSIE